MLFSELETVNSLHEKKNRKKVRQKPPRVAVPSPRSYGSEENELERHEGRGRTNR